MLFRSISFNVNPDNLDEIWVERELIDLLQIPEGMAEQGHFSETFDLRDFGVDYNPEWISIDLAGYNFLVSGPNEPGSIEHECLAIPEPATLALAGLGLSGLIGYVRRRRKV